jgi:glycosyltransferase involved in cell wall biosynthesis
MSLLGNLIVYVMRGDTRFITKKKWGTNDIIVCPMFKNRFADLMVGIPFYLSFLFFFGLLNKYDLLHVHNGATEGRIAIAIKKIKRIKFSYTYTFPFTAALKEKIKTSGFLRTLYYRLLIYYYEQNILKSHVVMPISELLGQEIIRTLSVPPDKHFILSEAASDLFLNYRSENISGSGKLQIAYVGHLGKLRSPEFIIRVFELVAEKIENVELLILGWADKQDELTQFKVLLNRSAKRAQINFIGKVPYEEVPRYLASCNIGISPIIPKDIYLVSTPTKCIEYLSLGIPVVANSEIPDQKHVIEQSGGGLLVKYDVCDFSEKIIYLLERSDIMLELGRKGKLWVYENRSFEKIAIPLNIRLQALIK